MDDENTNEKQRHYSSGPELRQKLARDVHWSCSETTLKLLWNCSEVDSFGDCHRFCAGWSKRNEENWHLCWLNCSETALKLLWNCSEIDWSGFIQRLSEVLCRLIWSESTHQSPLPKKNCSEFALKLLSDAFHGEIALELLWNWPEILPELITLLVKRTATVLKLP